MPAHLVLPARFSALDGWRGICALLVAIYHFSTTSHIGQWGLVRHAYLFVDFFFVLSGFVISFAYWDRLQTWRAAGVMMWRRMGRLWPLHVAMLAAFVALELAVPIVAGWAGVQRNAAGAFDPGSSAQLSAIPTNLLLLHGLGIHDRLTWNHPSWSISAEVWTYALFAVAVVATRGRTLVVAGLLALGAWLAVASLSTRYIAVDYELGLLRCVVGFMAGHVVYRLLHAMPRALPVTTSCEIMTVVAIGLFVAWAGRTPLELAAPVVFAAAVWVFAHEGGAVSRVLKAGPLAGLGLVSYSIYMVHALVIALIHRALTVVEQGLDMRLTLREGSQVVVAIGDAWAMDVFVAVYALVVVSIALLTWRFIEMPCQRRWNRLGVDARPREAAPATLAAT